MKLILSFKLLGFIVLKTYIAGLVLNSFDVHNVKNGRFKTKNLFLILNFRSFYININNKNLKLLLNNREISEIIQYKINNCLLFIKKIFINNKQLVKLEINVLKRNNELKKNELKKRRKLNKINLFHEFF